LADGYRQFNVVRWSSLQGGTLHDSPSRNFAQLLQSAVSEPGIDFQGMYAQLFTQLFSVTAFWRWMCAERASPLVPSRRSWDAATRAPCRQGARSRCMPYHCARRLTTRDDDDTTFTPLVYRPLTGFVPCLKRLVWDFQPLATSDWNQAVARRA